MSFKIFNQFKTFLNQIESQTKKLPCDIASIVQNTSCGFIKLELQSKRSKLNHIKTDIHDEPDNKQLTELVLQEKHIVKEIAHLQIKLNEIERDETLCKEEFPNIFKSFSQEHQALVLKEMYKLYSETLESSPEWKQQSDHEKHDQFLSKLQNHLNLSDHTTAFYQNLFKIK